MKRTKTQDVIEHLTKYGSITPKQAVDKYNLYRLSGVIHSLRKIKKQVLYIFAPWHIRHRVSA